MDGRTPNGVRIGAVYTPPKYRGRGYATACVAALSQRMLDTGLAFCFLYTDLSNPTSNNIYQRLGYHPVRDVVDYHFDESSEGAYGGVLIVNGDWIIVNGDCGDPFTIYNYPFTIRH